MMKTLKQILSVSNSVKVNIEARKKVVILYDRTLCGSIKETLNRLRTKVFEIVSHRHYSRIHKMYSYSGFAVLFFVFLFWSASAKPCGSWNFYHGGCNHDIILTHPVEEEIILLTFVEDVGVGADTGENENPLQSDDYIPTDADAGLDDKLSGEVVESVENKGLFAIARSDPLPSKNETQELPQETHNTTAAITDEEVGVTTAESTTEE